MRHKSAYNKSGLLSVFYKIIILYTIALNLIKLQIGRQKFGLKDIFAYLCSNLKNALMKIVLRLSTKTDANGMSEINLKGNKKIDGKVVTMRAKSEVYIMPMFFSEQVGVDLTKKRVIAQEIRQWHIEAKAKLDAILSAIAVAETDVETKSMTKDWMQSVVKEFLHPDIDHVVEEKPKTFYELAGNYIKNLDATNAFKRQLWVTVRCVARYEGFRKATEDGKFSFDLEKMRLEDIEAFMDYLRNEHDLSVKYQYIYKHLFANYPPPCPMSNVRKVERRGTNVIHTHMKRLRTMWRSFNEKGQVENNPFKGFKNVQEHYGNVTYITLEERNKIATTPMPTKHLETQRDIFIAQCRIGCRVSDLMRLTPAHIQGDMIVYVPKKTKDEGETSKMAYVPITKGLQVLIDKYKGVDEKGRLFPCISMQRYNDAIKEVFTIAGITRQVETRDSITGQSVMRPLNEIASSHMARRTFIANLYNKVADPTIIAQMSGHSEKSTSFARYRKQENDLLRKVAELAD